MALNFPSNPADQTPANVFSPTSTPEASDNGVTYTWDGTKWVADVNANLGSLYLSKTDDDTAAGAITFEGTTTHSAGVSVTGGTTIDSATVGVHSDIATATDTYNFYVPGSAPNYFNQIVGVGSGVIKHRITNTLSSSTTEQGVRITPVNLEIATNSTTASSACLSLNRLSSNNGVLIRFAENGQGVHSIALDGAGGINYGGMSDYRDKEKYFPYQYVGLKTE